MEVVSVPLVLSFVPILVATEALQGSSSGSTSSAQDGRRIPRDAMLAPLKSTPEALLKVSEVCLSSLLGCHRRETPPSVALRVRSRFSTAKRLGGQL